MIVRAPPLDRPDFDPPLNPANDLKLTLNFSGPTVTPTFFPYEMTDLTGWLEYKNNRVDLAHRWSAGTAIRRCGSTAREVRFFPDGVDVGEPRRAGDEAVRRGRGIHQGPAGQARTGSRGVETHGAGRNCLIKHLVMLTPPDSPRGDRQVCLLESPPQANHGDQARGRSDSRSLARHPANPTRSFTGTRR